MSLINHQSSILLILFIFAVTPFASSLKFVLRRFKDDSFIILIFLWGDAPNSNLFDL